MRQGDSLSPLLFAIFINDLAQEINMLESGVEIKGLNGKSTNLSLLMYADDIVLVAPTRDNAQSMLNVLGAWCNKWGMKVNVAKSQVVHVRNPQRPLCSQKLILNGDPLSFVQNYKYLGCWVNEYLNNAKTVDALTAAAGRSYGRIVNIFKYMGNMGYSTYCMLYESYVLPVANYAAAVWGYQDYPAPQVLQNRIERFFLGVHRFAANAAVQNEMNLLSMRYTCWLETLRFYNRLINLKDSRVTKAILNWDCIEGCRGWLQDVRLIAHKLDIPAPLSGDFTYDLDFIRNKLLEKNQHEWKAECLMKPKLRTYVEAARFEGECALVKSNLSRKKRSVMAKLMTGILPLEVEVGRFQGVPKEERSCRVCGTEAVEDENHFLFDCEKLECVRRETLENCGLLHILTEPDRLEMLLSADNMVETASFVDSLFNYRQALLFK